MTAITTDLEGQCFGDLVVVGYSHSDSKNSYWLCECICGNEKVIQRCSLVGGKTKSCGCLVTQVNRESGLIRREEIVGYDAIHRRLKIDLGFASEYSCVNCFDVADEWSLMHRQECDVHYDTHTGKPYSLDLNDYMPMCKSCHVKYDQYA